MAEKTEIAWCDSTFNPWIGCMKVSAGCDNCYAETMMDKRYHRVEWGQRKTLDIPGSVGTRIRTSESNWKNPVGWNARARGFHMTFGRRRRVFCSSLADVFDNQVDPSWRIDLFDLIGATEELDWLLLTKRPENIAKMLPTNWCDREGWSNVWLGTTCEDQAAYDKRWPILRDIPAKVRFISYEPAIGLLLALFLEPDRTPGIDIAYDEGVQDSMDGKTAKSPYDPSVPQTQSYLKGYHDETERRLKAGIKPDVKPNPSRAEVIAAARGPDVPPADKFN